MDPLSDEHLSPELPPPLPWLLHSGDAAILQNDQRLEGDARVWFTVLHKPAVRYEFKSPGAKSLSVLRSLDFENEIVVEGGISTELTSSHESQQTNRWSREGMASGYHSQGDAEHLFGGDASTLKLLRFHLLNFGDTAERIPRQFDVDGWTIRIVPTGTLPTLNGFAVTHVFDLTRSDASIFSIEDAQAAREWLFDALTFASGRLVGFAMAQGFVDRKPVYLEARCTRVEPWNTRRSWWDQRDSDSANLADLCSRWAAASKDDRTSELLRRVTGSYAAALKPEPLDIAVPVAGIGVELMVWELIQQRDQLLSTDEFDRLSFASRIRLAIRSAGIPTLLPEECKALQDFTVGAELTDGAHAFAVVRNRLVHPPKRKQSWPPPDVMTEAWFLGMEYLALLVLAALGYVGDYRSQFNYSGWMGAEISVPWRHEEQMPNG